jgi:hypothetical protein
MGKHQIRRLPIAENGRATEIKKTHSRQEERFWTPHT